MVDEDPMLTLPKFTVVALNERVSVAATPVPLKAREGGAPAALLTRDRLPPTKPATVGRNTTLNVLVEPAFTESGKVRPLVLKPEPVTFACVMVRTAFPGLLICIVCEFEKPTVTLPRLALEGVRPNFACVPVPLTVTTAFAPWVVERVTLPKTVSCALGLKVTFKVWVCPGVNVTGRVTPLVVVSAAVRVI